MLKNTRGPQVAELIGGVENCIFWTFRMYVIRDFESGRTSWAGHVALIGKNRNKYSVLVGKLNEDSLLSCYKSRCYGI
jgi:hypothetical protein